MLSEKNKIDYLLEELNDEEKFNLYKKLRCNYVKEDVRNAMVDYFYGNKDAVNEDIVNKVTYRFSYDCDYDCNLSYWDNITALIEEELKNKKEEKLKWTL